MSINDAKNAIEMLMKDYSENDLSKIIVDSAMHIHQILGPGLLESAYEECMFYTLRKHDILVEKQKPLPLIFEEVKLEIGYRVDLLINKKVII
jgi:GxxExxY protein